MVCTGIHHHWFDKSERHLDEKEVNTTQHLKVFNYEAQSLNNLKCTNPYLHATIGVSLSL
jgi:hypothetical protein